MQVTDVRIRKMNNEGRMKAIVSITFDQQFVVHDVRVIDGNNGLFVAMPSKRTPNGEFKDIAHPITSETRKEIQESVINAYELELQKEEVAEVVEVVEAAEVGEAVEAVEAGEE